MSQVLRLERHQKVGWTACGFRVAAYVSATMVFLPLYLTEAHGVPPASDSVFPYSVVFYLLAGLANSCYAVPLNAIAAEFTPNAGERSSLVGCKMIAPRTGMVMVTVLSSQIFTAFRDQRTGFAVYGLVFGLLIVATRLWSFFATTGAKPCPIARGLAARAAERTAR